MKTLTVGELKANFSEVLSTVLKTGEAVVISYGKKKERVAALVPIDQVKPTSKRVLGTLGAEASVTFTPNFSLTDEEFLQA
jgi:antitoxin (DNA-binding transcriptional repressor) of toxin-antitoxin stability system